MKVIRHSFALVGLSSFLHISGLYIIEFPLPTGGEIKGGREEIKGGKNKEKR